MVIWVMTEWLGLNSGVAALMNPVINEITIIPTRYPTAVNGPKNIVKNTQSRTYHAIDSENSMKPLKNPKCSVSNPEIKALSFVIANGEYGDLVIINIKNIKAASGIENTNGPWADWYAMISPIFIEPVTK